YFFPFAAPVKGKKYSLDFRHITDGCSQTLLAGEINYGFENLKWTDCSSHLQEIKWGDQTWAQGYWALSWGHIDWDLYANPLGGQTRSYNVDKMINGNATLRTYRSDHPGGSQFVHVDGSVHFVEDGVDYQTLRALVTRAEGDVAQ